MIKISAVLTYVMGWKLFILEAAWTDVMQSGAAEKGGDVSGISGIEYGSC